MPISKGTQRKAEPTEGERTGEKDKIADFIEEHIIEDEEEKLPKTYVEVAEMLESDPQASHIDATSRQIVSMVDSHYFKSPSAVEGQGSAGDGVSPAPGEDVDLLELIQNEIPDECHAESYLKGYADAVYQEQL